MIEIPPERLDPELLDAIIGEFVLREGTDYGERELPLADKIAEVRRQIARGEVVIVFDPESESCNLLTRRQFRQWSAANP
ncbi:MAG: YheU family protein [Porticoccaceae bacterium]|nr:YheU family protein [Porticoccaceae bacterium]